MTPSTPALVNGTASHAFELDDTGGCDHSGAVVVPAAVAAVELADRPVTGREFIDAVVIGYDVARRPLEACGAYEPHNGAGFHSTGTCGTFRCGRSRSPHPGPFREGDAECARPCLVLLLRPLVLRARRRAEQAHACGPCSLGRPDERRARTPRLSRGPDARLRGGLGRLQPFLRADLERSGCLSARTRRELEARRVSIKPHASCRSTHAAIDAVDNLRAAHGFTADDVEEVHVIINPFVYGMCGHATLHPMNSAQLSIPYSVAADLVFGSAGLPSFARAPA